MATLLHAGWMLAGSMAYSQCVYTFVLDRSSSTITLTIPANTAFHNILYDDQI